LKKYLEVLKKCPLFDRIDDDSLIRMLSCLGATVTSFDKKYTVFAEGSTTKYIGIVLSGSVQSLQIDYFGNRSILSNAHASELFCEEFACSEEGALPISVIATEPSEIMLIDCTHILHTCHNACGHHHMLVFNLMRTLADKAVSFHRRVEITSKRTTREKLMAYLTYQAKLAGKSSFDIPFDRQELADYLEVERSGLSSEIGRLRDEGILESRKRHFKLL